MTDKQKRVLWFVVLLLINMPAYLYNNFRIAGIIMAITQYTLVLYAAILLFYTKGKAFSPMYWMLMAAFLVEFIASLLNPLALPWNYFKSLVKSIGVWGFMDWKIRNNRSSFLKVYGMALSALIVVNLATIILFPDGMYTSAAYTHCYFLGYDNTHINVQLPALCVFALVSFESKRFRKMLWVLLAVVIISQLITASATSILGVAVFAAGVLLLYYGKKDGKLQKCVFHRPLVSFAVFGLVTIGLVAGPVLDVFQVIIRDILHKDGTMGGRVLIWSNSIRYISQRPMMGYGYEDGTVVNSQLVNLPGQTGWGFSSHNTYLWILFVGGIVLMAVIIAMFMLIDIRLKSAPGRKSQIIKLWIFAVMFMGLVESHYDGLLFSALIVGYNIVGRGNQTAVTNVDDVIIGMITKAYRRLILNEKE